MTALYRNRGYSWVQPHWVTPLRTEQLKAKSQGKPYLQQEGEQTRGTHPGPEQEEAGRRPGLDSESCPPFALHILFSPHCPTGCEKLPGLVLLSLLLQTPLQDLPPAYCLHRLLPVAQPTPGCCCSSAPVFFPYCLSLTLFKFSP